MRYNTEELLKHVPDYKSFLTLQELDNRANELSVKYGFKKEQIGKPSLYKNKFNFN